MWAAVRPDRRPGSPAPVNPSGDAESTTHAARAAGVEPTCRPLEGRADAETAGVA